ncbi:MAG: hypothetical protein WA885_23095 [Phormidesmis sp.]
MLISLSACGVAKLNQVDVVRVGRAEQTQQTDSVRIQVSNQSDFEMNDISIGFPSQTEDYGSLAPGETTAYRTVSESYRYALVETTVNGKLARWLPIDYVGEALIPNGNYTYELAYDPDHPYLSEGLDGQIRYQQTAIDREIDRALNEEMGEAIFGEYYEKYGENKTIWLYCVHQQTHRQESGLASSDPASQLTVYANVICAEPLYSVEGDARQKPDEMLRLPVKIELEEENGLFSVASYQFPSDGVLYKKELKQIFPSKVIEQMLNTPIRADTCHHLRFEAGLAAESLGGLSQYCSSR